jgi:H+-transporting ATPase
VVSAQQKVVFRVVRNLALFNSVIIVFLVIYARVLSMPLRRDCPARLDGNSRIDPGCAAGHIHTCRRAWRKRSGKAGRSPTRLSAVDEAASMDVLCVDKTGTLTQNELTVTHGSRHARLR